MIDLETPVPHEPRQKGPTRVVVAAVLAAAAVAAIALVVTRDDTPTPVDEPSPTVTVPPTVPPRALFGTLDEQFEPGTYFVDNVEGTPTPRIHITIGDGWMNTADGWGIGKEDVGYITFNQPERVFSDSCQPKDGYHPGPMTTLDGLVAALSEQQGWADVTAPSDITIDGYAGKAFQRTAPADFSDCSTLGEQSVVPLFPSMENEDENGRKGWSYYAPGETETLWILDVDGTMIVINTRVSAGQPAASQDEFAAVLDSIRIDPA